MSFKSKSWAPKLSKKLRYTSSSPQISFWLAYEKGLWTLMQGTLMLRQLTLSLILSNPIKFKSRFFSWFRLTCYHRTQINKDFPFLIHIKHCTRAESCDHFDSHDIWLSTNMNLVWLRWISKGSMLLKLVY